MGAARGVTWLVSSLRACGRHKRGLIVWQLLSRRTEALDELSIETNERCTRERIAARMEPYRRSVKRVAPDVRAAVLEPRRALQCGARATATR